jgi:HTH-type transcriptional regulator, competence development regulator
LERNWCGEWAHSGVCPQPQGTKRMPQTGLGVALKMLRERRTLSLREIGQLSSVDHAYVHRLESGEKTNPSSDLVEKLLKVLKPDERDAALVMWLVDHAEADHHLVEFVLNDPSISIDIFSAAAGVRHRGNTRPDPATLIARIQRAFEDKDD